MTLSTLFGVAALESLLKDASDFKDMEQLATCIFEGPNGPAEISRLFANRHRVAHEAYAPSGQADHSREIGAAWGIIYLAAIASTDLSSSDEFIDHLRGRVLARRVATTLRARGKNDLAEDVERAAKEIVKKPKKK